MKLEPIGNLGRIDLLERHLLLNKKDDSTIELPKEEVKEIEEQLSKFRYILSNLNLFKNTLKNDQYNSLVSIIEELDEYHKEYGKESVSI